MKNGQKKLPNGAYLLLYALSADGAVPNVIQILPFGKVESKKGPFLTDEKSIAEIIKAFNAETNDLVIDYEHQTLTGEEAPAAGWIKELIDKGVDGLWAKVKWTPRAVKYIKNMEYKYLSPVILVRKSDGRAILLHSAALTNTPAIDGMQALANKLELLNIFETEDENTMEFLKKLALKLGLKETATEDEVMQAVVGLSQIVANKEIMGLLGLSDKATLDEAKGKITALKSPAKIVADKEVLTLLDLSEAATLDEAKGKIIALKNPSGYVKAEDFSQLKEKLDKKERDELVNLALKSGKVAPAQKEWAETYALKDPAGFKAFLDNAPQVVPLEKIPGGDPPARTAPDETQMSVNKALGISDEDYKKFG